MDNLFVGPFKKYLREFYEYKINLGYVYDSEKNKLKDFDKFTIEKYPKATKINKEILEDFLNRKEIKRSSKSSFASVLRQLCKYLNVIGIEAYQIPYKKYSRGKEAYVPHIYTDKEIKIFFETAKNYSKENTYKNTIIYTVFDLLYCTGMRISECLNIKIKDIDYTNQTINIYNTKNTESRIIAINEKLIKRLKEINENYNQELNPEEYFFRHGNGAKYSPDSFYHIFRNILYYSKIPHTSKGPRLHDFRHLFCILSLKKAVLSGIDINNFLPILSAYVGHKKVSSTAYYLRLTSDMYPEIRTKIENYTNEIIRKVDDIDYD